MISFALIGRGRIAKRHADLRDTGQVAVARLAAVCDVHAECARALGKRHGVPRFDSIDALLAASSFAHLDRLGVDRGAMNVDLARAVGCGSSS